MMSIHAIFPNRRLLNSFFLFILISLFSSQSQATIILSTDATVSFDSAPYDGQIFLVTMSYPYLPITITGSASSEVSWKIGTEDDFLLNGFVYGDLGILLYTWRLTIDGIGSLHTGHSIIGNTNCGSTEWEDGQLHYFACGITPYEVPVITESKTVGVGGHLLVIHYQVVSSELQILQSASLIRSFKVVAVPAPEPPILLIFGSALFVAIGLKMYARTT